MIEARENIWYPGEDYQGRSDDEYTQPVADISLLTLTERVQKRVQEDGEWAIEHGFVGQSDKKMRRMMVFASAGLSIQQSVGQILREKQAPQRTVDWVCRDLATMAKRVVR